MASSQDVGGKMAPSAAENKNPLLMETRQRDEEAYCTLLM